MPHDTALLIIDVQKGLFEFEPPVHAGEELLATLNSRPSDGLTLGSVRMRRGHLCRSIKSPGMGKPASDHPHLSRRRSLRYPLQACINASVDGDRIQFAAGAYVTSVTLSRAVSLVGAGADSTTLNALVNQLVLAVTGTTITATDFDG